MSKLITSEGEFDDVMTDNAQYGRIQFWDLRYANEHEPFEWYYGYEYFRETIREFVPLNARTMIAGCGSSNLIGDMADDGYESLVAGDWSRVVMAQLKYRYRDYPNISFFQGNMTDTDLPEGSFGAIIDKALFDSMLCTQTSAVTVAQYIFEVRPSTSLFRCVHCPSHFLFGFQCERLLDDTGVLIIISYGSPEQRLHFLEQYDIDEPHFTPWIVEVQALRKPTK